MKAVVTAGGRVDAAYARAAGTEIKALARVRGTTMLDRIVEALRGAGVTRIAVVGGEEVREACADRVESIVAESASGSENILKALSAWPEDGEPLLYATSDLPYVTATAVVDFVRRVPPGAMAMAVAEFDDFAARFPDAPAFGIRLGNDRVVNGGVFWLPAGSSAQIATLATRLFQARKQPWRMATLVSPLALLRFAVGRLSVAQLEAAACKALNGNAAAVRRCAPELGFDADTLVEYRYASENS